jgi:hypothetical protein
MNIVSGLLDRRLASRQEDRRLCRHSTEYAGDSDAGEKEDLQLAPI